MSETRIIRENEWEMNTVGNKPYGTLPHDRRSIPFP